jgi:hypothetical protein
MWVVAVLVVLVGGALLVLHGVAFRAVFDRFSLPIGAVVAIVVVAVVVHFGFLAPLLRRHRRPRQD